MQDNREQDFNLNTEPKSEPSLPKQEQGKIYPYQEADYGKNLGQPQQPGLPQQPKPQQPEHPYQIPIMHQGQPAQPGQPGQPTQNYQPGYQQYQPYGQPYGQYQPQQAKASSLAYTGLGLSIAGLVFSLLSIIPLIGGLGLVLSVAGLVISILENKKQKSGIGLAGIICGAIGLGFSLLGLIACMSFSEGCNCFGRNFSRSLDTDLERALERVFD